MLIRTTRRCKWLLSKPLRDGGPRAMHCVLQSAPASRTGWVFHRDSKALASAFVLSALTSCPGLRRRKITADLPWALAVERQDKWHIQAHYFAKCRFSWQLQPESCSLERDRRLFAPRAPGYGVCL